MRRVALLIAALAVPVLTAAVPSPAFAVADNVICVGPAAGPCNDFKLTISAAVATAEGNSVPDTIFVGPGTYDDGPYSLTATDPLTIKGSGEGATFLTLPPSATQQTYLTLDGATVRDLTITLNTVSHDGDRGMALHGFASAESVTVAGTGTTNTTGATMIDSVMSDVSLFLDADVYPGTRGIFSEGYNVVSDVTITAGEGYNMSQPFGTDTLSRMSIGAGDFGIVVDAGTVAVDDSLIQLTDDGTGLAAANFNTGEDDKAINADHVTIVGGGAGSTGARAYAATPEAQQLAEINLTNSIISGPERSLVVEASNDGSPPGDSSAFINASYSDWDVDDEVETVDANGVGDIISVAGNVDVTPGFVNPFAGNYRLVPSSPLVDAGDPAAGPHLVDLDRLSRVVDGDGDGLAVPDMGAYEYRVPAPPPTIPPTPPAPPADTVAPQTTITKKPAKKVTAARVTFKFTSSEAGSTFQCKRDKRSWRTCASPYRFKVAIGRHVFRVRAMDAAGNVEPRPARYAFERLPSS
jgi:hypothetical protein